MHMPVVIFFACLPSSPEGYAGQVISTENPNFEMASRECPLVKMKVPHQHLFSEKEV